MTNPSKENSDSNVPGSPVEPKNDTPSSQGPKFEEEKKGDEDDRSDQDGVEPPNPTSKDKPKLVEEEKAEEEDDQDGVDKDECQKDTEPSIDTTKTSPLPLICLKQGLNRKESPLKLESWVALSLTLDGRDKITKVFQYSARFLAWWLVGSAQAERFKTLKASLTMSRKAFRLGRTLIEYYKLRSMGLLKTLGWHLHQTLAPEDRESSPPPRLLVRRVSSNIGWSPATLEETTSARRSFYRSLSGVAYRKMYRPMISRMSSSMMGDASQPPSSPLWVITAAAMKLVGLAGFWTGDNINFLTYSGLFDDVSVDQKAKMARRKQIQKRASSMANRFYFFGALSGLLVSVRNYWDHRVNVLRKLQRDLDDTEEDDFMDRQSVEKSLERAKEKQFTLFLALLKSCCDVLVFSNNPGIDLWEKLTGRKLNEGVHCVGGLLSASTVLYNNFPNSKK